MSKTTMTTETAIHPFRVDIPQADLGDTTIRPLAERDHNVVHWAEFDRGGHFAAMEAPDLLVRDVREFFRPLRSG
jgi:hypothetical protein